MQSKNQRIGIILSGDKFKNLFVVKNFTQVRWMGFVKL